MKNIHKILVLVILAAGLSSCDWIDSWSEIEIDTEIAGELHILTDETEMKSTDGYGFNESITVHVLNDDLYEYEDEIEDFKVSGARATVESLSVESVVLLAGSKFTISNSNYNVEWTFGTDVPVSVGSFFDLDDAGLYDMVEDILDDRVEFTMTADGECDTGGVSMVIRLGIETTVTANPL